MRISRLSRPLLAVLLTGTLGAGAAGCSLPGGDGGADGTGLERALDTVPASAADQAVTYRDVRKVRRLVAEDPSLYRGLDGFGILEVAQSGYTGKDVGADWGFDEKDVTASVQVGEDSLLTGDFDTSAVGRAMNRQGFGATGIDGGTRFEKRGEDVAYEVSGSVRVADRSQSGLGVSAPAKSLRDDAAYAAVADCLGDVYEATYYAKRDDADAELFAIGGRLAKDGGTRKGGTSTENGTSTEKLCVRAASPEAADRVAETLRTKTGPDARYASSKVRVTEDGMVTMAWRNQPRSGLRPADNDRTGELPNLLNRG
ncbi:hypothetical protein [Streptomyces sp. A1499]|uniref:hypothetical protein n=1 Tax=Streptomyces sp. A1499 TaxID=2563104 RepID=UPI00109E5BCA|nr:hypothetical protein [Streptomyces sp. A1499]THC42358.1 hypothetical protein E7X58_35775 [Streptomyces sp. A1499]